MKKLVLITWNCESPSTSLFLLPKSYFEKVDAISLTETWTTNEIHLPGFYAVCCHANSSGVGRPSGGVAVLLNERLRSMETLLSEDNCIVIEGDRINIVALYVRLRGAEETHDVVDKLVNSLHRVADKGLTIVAGDLNARLDKPDDSRTIAFEETLHEFGYWITSDPEIRTFKGPMGQ